MTDTLRTFRLLWRANSVSWGIDAQFNIIGRGMSSESLIARSHPAQDGEDEADERDECSQAAVDDGEVAGVVIDCDCDRLEVCGCRVHGCCCTSGQLCSLKGLIA